LALNERQKAFADYYIELGNATQAAIKAGYSEDSARSIGSENLTKPDISAYIESRLAEIRAKRVADANEVIEFYTAVMRGEVKDQFGLDASLSDRLKAGDALMRRYNAIKETESKNTFNEGMQSLADLINNPAPNRNISDFEGDDDD
jgi:phage terminase small subunit